MHTYYIFEILNLTSEKGSFFETSNYQLWPDQPVLTYNCYSDLPFFASSQLLCCCFAGTLAGIVHPLSGALSLPKQSLVSGSKNVTSAMSN